MAVDLAEASYVVESDSFGGVLSAFQNSLKLLFSQHFMVSRIFSAEEPTLKITIKALRIFLLLLLLLNL